MVEFAFSYFEGKDLFWVNSEKKHQNCRFQLELGTYNNSNL